MLLGRVFDIAAGNSGGPESAYRASSLEFCKFCGFAGFSNRNVSRLLEALQGVPQRPKRSMERPGIDPDILEEPPRQLQREADFPARCGTWRRAKSSIQAVPCTLTGRK